MIHYLPDRLDGRRRSRDDLTPSQIVEELDRHIVGQDRAKRSVAIALRNRQRRRKLPPDLAAEVLPKNIILIGPTGVGKTEIARRIARLTGSPFIKVEASRFTEAAAGAEGASPRRSAPRERAPRPASPAERDRRRSP